jgi:hypothetical protein
MANKTRTKKRPPLPNRVAKQHCEAIGEVADRFLEAVARTIASGYADVSGRG